MKTDPTSAFVHPHVSLTPSTGAKKAGTGRAGFTLPEIMIIVAIVGILAAIAIPSFLAARVRTHLNSCMTNMCKIEDAKEQWAMANSVNNGTLVPWDELLDYFKIEPSCPAGGTYAHLEVGQAVYCTTHDWRAQYTEGKLPYLGLKNFHP